MGESESEDWDDPSDPSARRRRRFERALLHATMFTSAEGTHTNTMTYTQAAPREGRVSQVLPSCSSKTVLSAVLPVLCVKFCLHCIH